MRLLLLAALAFGQGQRRGLEDAARAPEGGGPEAAAASASGWADGGEAAPEPVEGGLRRSPLPPPKALPPGHPPPPIPPNEAAPTFGFAAAFTVVESPALGLMQIPYVGKPLGGLLFLILLIPALIVGGIAALIGLAYANQDQDWEPPKQA